MKNDHNNRIGYVPEQPEEKTPPKPSRRAVSLLRIALVALCAAVFVFCVVKLVSYFSDIAKSKSASKEIGQVYEQAESEPTSEPGPETAPTEALLAAQTPTVTPAAESTVENATETEVSPWPSTYENNPTLRVSATFAQLKEKNKDIVAWLKIPDVVEEAVVLRDNEYYLSHNALGESSVTGALFLDESTNLSVPPQQFLIHGHNMKEGSMFGSLKKYKVKGASFYHSNAFVTFNTQYENGEYVIFAVCEVSVDAASERYLPFWSYGSFPSAESFTAYVKRLKDLSQLHCDIDVIPGDRLLILSTCYGSEDDARLLVAARKIRADENRTDLNMTVMAATDR